MSNSYKDTTGLWVVDTTGNLDTDPVNIIEVVYIPSAANDDLILSDTSDNPAIVLKAGATDASPVHMSFHHPGRRLPNLKVNTIDGGTAYIYMRIT